MTSNMREGSVGSSSTPEPVAIVGIGCRLPGDVSNPSQLWDLLMSKGNGWREFTPERINIDGYYHPNGNRPGSLHTRGANLLAEDPRLFDHRFFGIKDSEIRTMDPNQRKMLEVAYEAFESAAEPWDNFSGSRTGVFVGNFNTDYQMNHVYDIDFILPYAATGTSASVLSNRINHVFNLRGPSVTVDTACSSSMYALHMAVNAIRNNDCDAAIVGGSNLILSPEAQELTKSLGALSETSTCHTFDASADGYGRAEGFGALYLKRYSEAVRGQYPIRAVIRGTAINSNGKTAGISHPGVEGQEALIRQAYDNAKLSPQSTGYFECHGTGTPVGDPVEVAAIGRVFASTRASPLLVGSVKTNLGHSESASGITGVIKCVLALENDCIPPTAGVTNLNPAIDFDTARVEVVTEPTRWPTDLLRRASVNSFGYGGANAHCILDHPEILERENIASIVPNGNHHSDDSTNGYCNSDSLHTNRIPASRSSRFDSVSGVNGDEVPSTENAVHTKLEVDEIIFSGLLRSKSQPQPFVVGIERHLLMLPFSGHDARALSNNMSMLKPIITQGQLLDTAHTLARRTRFRFRSYQVVDTGDVSETYQPEDAAIFQSEDSNVPQLAFVFTGQGAQWQSMGKALLAFEAFRSSILAQNDVICSLSNKPPWTVTEFFYGDTEYSIQDAEVSQTICTSLQIGIVDLLHSWSITPHAVVGHSSGEIAAAYASGFISRAEAVVIAFCRGQAIAKLRRNGLMLATGLSELECQSLIAGQEEFIKIAAVNSPSSVTLSGDKSHVEDLHSRLQGQGAFSRILKTGGNAYHSHHMKAVGEIYDIVLRNALEEIKGRNPEIVASNIFRKSWISSVTPDKTMKQKVDASYWRQNLEAPVQFSRAVTKMITSTTASVDILVEIGPHSALQGPLQQIITAEELRVNLKRPQYLPSLKRFENEEKSLMHLCGNLFCSNYPMDIMRVNAREIPTKAGIQCDMGSVRLDLPTYQYNYGPIVSHETRISREIRQRKFLRHDLIGYLQPGCAKRRPTWRNLLRLKDIPWLNDHKLLPNSVLPGSAYVCMAIEALSQHVSEQPKGLGTYSFKLRNVLIKSALQIPENDTGVEVLTNLHASSGSPKWYEFQVSSVSEEGTWTEHASGLVSISSAVPTPTRRLDEGINQRFIDVPNWYSHFTQAGLGYGPAFSKMLNLTSDPYKNVARASIHLNPAQAYFNQGPESHYLAHPASLDICHQLSLIAAHGGQTDQFKTAFIPVAIEEMVVWPGVRPQQEWGYCVAKGQRLGLRGAHASYQIFAEDGTPIAETTNLKCVSYDGGVAIEKPETHEYLRLVWKPDISVLSNHQANNLFPPPVPAAVVQETFEEMDRLAMYMIMELQDRCGASRPSSPHLQRFLRWINKSSAIESSFAEVVRSMTSAERQHAIDSIVSKLSHVVDIEIANRMFANMNDILTETTTGLEVALRDGILTKVYTSGLGISVAYKQLSNVLDLLGHSNPNMDILEVGAGTGAATNVAMSTLAPERSPKRYGSYTFTDVTGGFIHSAQSEFSRCKSMTFGVFDMNSSPHEQGFKMEYDVIIASECVHATSDVENTLRNIRSLLKPNGRLVLLETTRPLFGQNIIYGTFTDWWSDDEEKDTPFLTTAEWKRALQASNFSGVDFELSDYEAPYGIVSTIVATANELLEIDESLSSKEEVYIVHRGAANETHRVLSAQLQQEGLTPVLRSFEDTIPPSSRIILCLDNDRYSVADATEQEFLQLKSVIRSAKSALWLVIGDSLQGSTPRSATTVGLVRMLTTENPEASHGIILLEKPLDLHTDLELLSGVIHRERLIHFNDFEREVAVKDGIFYTSRLIFDEDLNAEYRERYVSQKETAMKPMGSQAALSAHFSKPGLISSLVFQSDDSMLEPLQPDHIEIRTAAIGLNWKDLATSTGKIDMDTLSSECSGIITKCGSTVQGLKPGDHIYALAWAKFGTTIRIPAGFAQKMRPEDSFEEMAGVPIVFCTAHYGLNHLARLERGERVLIQGATGGVGLAAIQVAKRIGADIYVTAGNKAKVDFLHEQMGIDKEHILSSRNDNDLQRIPSITNGRGFDVIFSTSTGSMMHESWRHLAPRGRFIDIGRVDVQNGATLSMEVFRRNALYASFDLSIMARQDVDFCTRLMREVNEMMIAGVLHPVSPLKTFDISELESALIYFSQGKHIGKVAVTYTVEAPLKIIPHKPSARFDSDSVYIIVGGAGGFGLGILQMMTMRGARHLQIWSRSGVPTPEAVNILEELAQRGINVPVVKCDITDASAVDASMSNITLPIKGIIHAAVTFCDHAFEVLTYADWTLGLSAKVTGTQNLHEATLKYNLNLDFFIMTSSYEAVVALPTQATYCAANSFQDAFARYRRSIGLPACAIAVGLITEIGYVGQVDITRNMIDRNNLYGTGELGILRLLEAAFLEAPLPVHHDKATSCPWRRFDPLAEAQITTCLEPTMLAAMLDKNGTSRGVPRWVGDKKFSHIVRATEDQRSGNITSTQEEALVSKVFEDVHLALSSGKPHYGRTLVITATKDRMSGLLRIPVGTIQESKSVAEYGVDSLIAVELRNWFLTTFKTAIPLLRLLDESISIAEQAEWIVQEIHPSESK